MIANSLPPYIGRLVTLEASTQQTQTLVSSGGGTNRAWPRVGAGGNVLDSPGGTNFGGGHRRRNRSSMLIDFPVHAALCAGKFALK